MVGIKVIRLTVILLTLLTVVGFAACTKDQPTPTTTQPASNSTAQPKPSGSPAAKPGSTQTAPNQTGAVTQTAQLVTVGGVGTVAVTNDMKMYFGSSGKIEKIGVSEGDKVKKGTFLAKLDTSTLEAALVTAQLAVEQAKLAKVQSASTLANAQSLLDKTKAVGDIKDVIFNLQWEIKVAQMNLAQSQNSNDSAGSEYWRQVASNDQKTLAQKQKDMSDLLGKTEYTGTITYDIMGDKYNRVTVDDMKMKQLAVDAAQQTLDKSDIGIAQAQKNVEVAQKQLNDATLTAPFDGQVATLDFKEGDVLAAPTSLAKPTIYYIDPTMMQMDLGINELDVPKIKIGQKATVKVDAYPGIKLDGKVTAISPTATLNGGIVDYPVTVTFTVPSNLDVKVGMNGAGSVIIQ
jgi:HlyD family secretion protein